MHRCKHRHVCKMQQSPTLHFCFARLNSYCPETGQWSRQPMFWQVGSFKIKGDSASKECREFLVQQRRVGTANIADYEFTTSLSFPWGASRRPVEDAQRATVLMPRSPAGSLCAPPLPSPLQSYLPTVSLCGVNSSSSARVTVSERG